MHSHRTFIEPLHTHWMRRWLITGVVALALSGVFAIILVVARTPGLSDSQLWKDLFQVSLVIHVDLSVWVWFLAVLAISWCALMPKQPSSEVLVAQRFAWGSFTLGVIAMAFSPLEGEWLTYKSNYIPVLHNPVFLLGLGLVLAGAVIASAMALKAGWANHTKLSSAWMISSAYVTLLSMLGFVFSVLLMPEGVTGLGFYEHAFWAGGHIGQYATTQLMLFIWLTLAFAIGWKVPHKPKFIWLVLLLGPIAVTVSPIAFVLYDVTDYEFQKFFTWQMNMGGGLAAILLFFALASRWPKAFWPKCEDRALWSSLIASITLFGLGGLIGSFIDGANVKIPAHYHGSIVGVTLAFMGYIYYLLPRWGYANVAEWKLAFIQPLCYGIGQILHIGGLAISGGYGVLRKTAGGFDGLEPSAKIALQVMGGGGLLAIIGGLLFVVVVVKALRRGPTKDIAN